MSSQQFFYDGQIRRFITQFIRAVSGYQVEFANRNGGTTLQRVPVIYGDSSRSVASIINNNSPSTTPTVPVMAVYVSDLRYDRDRVQDPTYVGKMILRERQYDPITGGYTTQQADTITVERMMPVPYKLILKLDIWTSNTDQKLQLVEQLSSLFNPAMEIQSTDNYIDWTSLTAIYLTDTAWTSRTIPIGTENPIDVATLTFELPIWLSPPAKVKRMGVVQKIVANIYDNNGDIDQSVFDDINLISRQYLSPMEYGVILLGNQLTLVKYSDPIIDAHGPQSIKTVQENISDNVTISVDSVTGLSVGMQAGNISGVTLSGTTYISNIIDDEKKVTLSANVSATAGSKISFNTTTAKIGEPINWRDIINVYGTLTTGISQIRIELANGGELKGVVGYKPGDDTVLLFNIDEDTTPVDTISPPVTAIIDPQRSRPGYDLPEPAAGTRYLLLSDYATPEGAQPEYNWVGVDGNPLEAYANDIIAYDGFHWAVVFSGRTTTSTQYVTNLTTMMQYRWTGAEWVKSYEGFYKGGLWSLVL